MIKKQRRMNPDKREKENERRRQRTKNNNFEDLVKIFDENIKDGPIHNCYCCDRLWFKTSIKTSSIYKLKQTGCTDNFIKRVILDEFITPNENDVILLCSTCYINISGKKKKEPKFCIKTSDLAFPEIPDVVKKLTPMEERLVSPRIPFMKIHTLGCDGQKGLKGAIVLVPCSVQQNLSMIPLLPQDTQTIQIKLKRKMEYKHHYQYERISPQNVLEAARYLVTTELFKKLDINLNSVWESMNVQEFNVNPDDIDCDEGIVEEGITELSESLENINESQFDENEQVDCQQVTLFESCDGIEFAPGEGQTPLPLLFDEFCEELAFPSIWGGQARKHNPFVKISYEDQVNSELRRRDRRAVGAEHLLFVNKKSQCKQLQSNLNIALKKNAQTSNITAIQALDKNFINEKVDSDNAYRFMSGITGSPAYWEKQKKNIFAMVRQFGIFTLFVTLSAAETHWPELLKILKKTVDKEDDADVSELDWMEKTRLIQSDPITCALYFNHRFRELRKTWSNVNDGPFEGYKIIHTYYRIEFQHRGSPHVHMVLWLENAPEFVPEDCESNARIEEFIDKIVTTSSDETSTKDLMKYQHHKCTHTCKRTNRGKNICRFGAPFFPMRNTRILSPFSDAEKSNMSEGIDEAHKTLLKNIQILLNDDPSSIENFDEMLRILKCNDDEYIAAIRSQIKTNKIFIKRQPKDCRINPYSIKILRLMKSNMDIQFVLDPYACIGYIVDYINKSNRGLSRMLRTWLDEFRKGDSGLRKQLQGLANVFYNGTEISSQEAAWCRLRLPMSCSSDVAEFINTSPISKRQRMLKSNNELLKLDPLSTDIMKTGNIERYADRPDELDNICLAEFVAWYNFSGSRDNDNEDEECMVVDQIMQDDVTEEDGITSGSKNLKLKTLKGILRRRKCPKVIRFVRFDMVRDRINHFREMIMLFKPWRKEFEEVESQNCEEIYKQNCDVINNEYTKYNRLDINIQSLYEEIEEQRQLEDMIDERNSEEQNDVVMAFDYDESTVQPNLMIDIGEQEPPIDTTVKTFTVPEQMKDEEYYQLCNSLNTKQRDYLMHIVNMFKLKQLPVYHFVSGKAGVGKSRLINAIYQSVLRIFRRNPGPVDSLEVVLIAYTGKAAHNIGGMTAHSTFNLLVSQNQKDTKNLSPELLNTLRVKLRNMKLLIIDEISMLGSNMLFNIHRRLCQIFGTTEPFGGRSVVVLGDFNQLRPVGDAYVFKPCRDPLATLVGNTLWSKFKIFELTEIMRQRDDLVFAQALGRLAGGVLTIDDEEMFKKRCYLSHECLPDHAKNAIHLFKTNNEVDEYNVKRVQELTNEGDVVIRLRAIDKVVGSVSDTDRQQALHVLENSNTKDTYGLPKIVDLQIGVRYMVTTNIDVSDGLFNGATGVLRFIETNSNMPIRVWIEFDDVNVGNVARSKCKIIADTHKLSQKLTPIEKVKKVFQVTKKGKAQICREQFPLVVAEGMTIHKSQGQSMSTVVVKLSERMDRCLLYVALSRATSLMGLFLIGKFKSPSPPKPTDEVTVEMERLRKYCLLTPIFSMFHEVPDNTIQIITHNVQSIRKHIKSISCDPIYNKSHVILLQETWALANETFTIDGFKEINRNKFNGRPSANGTMIYAANNSHIVAHDSTTISEKFGNNQIEMTTCCLEGITIINIYNHPKTNFEFFKKILIENENIFQNRNILFCGDFNSDFSSSKVKNQIEVFLYETFNLCLISPRCPTTDDGTTIDAVFGKLESMCTVFVYESIFSFHKPIIIRLRKNE